jgi:hypothetical protein
LIERDQKLKTILEENHIFWNPKDSCGDKIKPTQSQVESVNKYENDLKFKM